MAGETLIHCEILGSYLQKHHQHYVFRALVLADPHSQGQENKEGRLSCQISRYQMSSSGHPYIAMQCYIDRGQWMLGLYSWLVWADFQTFHNFSLHLVWSLVVGLRLRSCALVMLLPIGAKAPLKTHSGSCTCMNIKWHQLGRHLTFSLKLEYPIE